MVRLKRYLRTIRANATDRYWWRDVAIPHFLRTTYYRWTQRGIRVLKEDWDNLVLFDACRYDMLAETGWHADRLESRRSRGSNTPEFLTENFVGADLLNTVYVTGNPQVDVYLSDECYEVVSVWESAWDEKLGTVPPGPVTEAAIEAHEQYPDKRIVVHYMQPHYPFVGETGREAIGEQSGVELSRRLADGEADADRDHATVWERLQAGELNNETVWNAYIENLELVLPHVEELLDAFAGRTVVTSDHGNMAGERVGPLPFRLYGHPYGIYTPELVKVPWLVFERGERKRVAAGDRSRATESVGDAASRRLEALGYR
ncbi:hypothetical protein ACFQGE_14710 [Halomicroarcula sp. GCM10025817]|uniref:hypothetical protein n=1 Tax=Haloarcula TaxID=2237 RepID=UPI0023E8A806|nr:hypothetical protein [Halomicroarcula sp. SYNS111]